MSTLSFHSLENCNYFVISLLLKSQGKQWMLQGTGDWWLCAAAHAPSLSPNCQEPDLKEIHFFVPLVEIRLLQRAMAAWSCSKMGSRCIGSVHWYQELQSPSRHISTARIKQNNPEVASLVWHRLIPILVQNADKICKDFINGGFSHSKLYYWGFKFSLQPETGSVTK